MKNKKIYSIIIVIAFIIVSFSAVTIARQSPEKISIINKEIKDTGTVFSPIKNTNSILNIRSTFLIKGDNGHDVTSLYFETYCPLNLPDEYQQEGLKVGFIAKLSPIISIRHMLICIKYHALPIIIKDIWHLEEPKCGSIAGFVCEEDEKCPPIDNAKVVATLISSPSHDHQDPVKYEKYTNELGAYRINNVIPGEYKIVASHQVYKQEEHNIIVEENEETCQNFTLKKISETAVLTLFTNPGDIPLSVFTCTPESDGIIPTTDGKLHLIYPIETEVQITVEEQYGEFVFSEWINSESEEFGNDNPKIVIMDKDKEFIAKYDKEPIQEYQLNVKIEQPGEGSISVIPPNVDVFNEEAITLQEGTMVQLEAVGIGNTYGHFEFSHWSGDLTGEENPENLLMDSDKTVTAHFIEVEH